MPIEDLNFLILKNLNLIYDFFQFHILILKYELLIEFFDKFYLEKHLIIHF